jgi:hypothetical protein
MTGVEGLAAILARHAIDAGSLAPLFDSGQGEIYTLRVRGAEALALWRRLRGLTAQTGHWPVLLGDDNSIEYIIEVTEDLQAIPIAEIIRKAGEIDPAFWLEARANNDPDTYSCEPGDWPSEAEPNHEFTIPTDLSTGKPLAEVYLALVPATTGWLVPAYLRYGGWNDCPVAEEHVSLMKRWHELYGAEVVGMSFDVIEMQVARPPTDRAAALALAREQFIYCSDIVQQGTGALEDLAATLLGATAWFFWWD